MRWLPPIAGTAVALALIFYLYRDLDFGRFLEGLRQANPAWIGVLALTILLEQVVRVPGGFVIGSAFAFKLLGVPEEQALLMILFNYVMSIAVVVGGGLIVLWQSGLDIRQSRNPDSSHLEL